MRGCFLFVFVFSWRGWIQTAKRVLTCDLIGVVTATHRVTWKHEINLITFASYVFALDKWYVPFHLNVEYKSTKMGHDHSYWLGPYYSSTFRCNKLVFTDINTLNFLSLTQVDQRNEKFFYPAFKGPLLSKFTVKDPPSRKEQWHVPKWGKIN